LPTINFLYIKNAICAKPFNGFSDMIFAILANLRTSATHTYMDKIYVDVLRVGRVTQQKFTKKSTIFTSVLWHPHPALINPINNGMLTRLK